MATGSQPMVSGGRQPRPVQSLWLQRAAWPLHVICVIFSPQSPTTVYNWRVPITLTVGCRCIYVFNYLKHVVNLLTRCWHCFYITITLIKRNVLCIWLLGENAAFPHQIEYPTDEKEHWSDSWGRTGKLARGSRVHQHLALIQHFWEPVSKISDTKLAHQFSKCFPSNQGFS